MNKIWHRIKRNYQNLKIKNKLFILIFSILILSFSFAFMGLQYAFHIYDEQLYSKSSQVLSTSSNSIEGELKHMEEVTYSILTDPQIQQYLASVSQDGSEYEKFLLRNKMMDKLWSYVNREKYIDSVKLLDVNGGEYALDDRNVKLTQEQKSDIVKQAIHADGSNVWINPPNNNFTIATARTIKQYSNLSFDNIGTIIIYIDMEKLVGDILEGSSKMDGEFFIANKQDLIFPKNVATQFNELPLNVKNGYQVKEIGQKNYFLVQIQSNYFDWNYINVIPFNQIFKDINIIKTVFVFVFFLMFMIVMIVGIRFAKNITTPLENLVASMEYLKVGDFKEAKKEALKSPITQEDEVGKLQQNFQSMTQTIDELINENYAKQLTIKETEFKALQAQINPHFLYNTLESINWLAKGNGQFQISKMVEALGFLLRNSISLKKPMITIGEELNIVKNYIIIQKYRFEDRLDFQIGVDAELFRLYIPKLTLQPLVENAINYALEPMVEPCKIRIYSSIKEQTLQLIVEDNGPGMEPAYLEKLRQGQIKTRGQGVGIANINERIKLSYGEDYGIKIDSVPNQGTKVMINLPFREEEVYVQRTVSG
ncbi:cache domain-containing sensor histidine kinase [Neobacillus dielmonensis]|uniref:cache domain-containing sensor histidine kinase n=1 Tax=Neobacillus dielmonensis TaxID=1347369 RepID=UPI0005A7FE0D|nr:sensor histidine kinase [Neobacillus dielmonensis]